MERLVFTKILHLRDLSAIQILSEICRRVFLYARRWEWIFHPTVGSEDYSATPVPTELFCPDVVGGCNLCDEEILCEFVADDVFSLPVPHSIHCMLEKYIPPTVHELITWIQYHNSNVFRTSFYENQHYVLRFLDSIVWKTDGTIDYGQTALRMLSNVTLNESEKLRIKSVFQLEQPVYDTPEELLMDQCTKATNSPAIFFFWNQLSLNQQVRAAISLIQKHRVKLQIELLTKMNSTQQMQIFTQISGEVIFNFVRKPSHAEFALKVWVQIKDLITEDNFEDMMMYMLTSYNFPFLDDFSDFFEKMWRTTPDRLKRRILTRQFLFDETIFEDCEFVTHLLFLKEILPDIPLDMRRKILNRRIPSRKIRKYRLLIQSRITNAKRPLLINDIIKLCLPSAEDQAAFIDRWISQNAVNKARFHLLMSARFGEFEEFIAIYFPHVTNLAAYKIHLLTSEDGTNRASRLLRSRRYTLMNEIINHVFSEPSEAANFRVSLFQSHTVIETCFHNWLENRRLEYVINCVKRFLRSDAEREAAKKHLSEFYVSEELGELIGIFSESQWREFLEFFFDNEASISLYKQSLRVVEVFSGLVAGMSYGGEDEHPESYQTLERFLEWYFESPDERKRFKIRVIFEFIQIPKLRELFQIDVYDIFERSDLYELLRWFFRDANQEEINEFKSIYRDHVVRLFME